MASYFFLFLLFAVVKNGQSRLEPQDRENVLEFRKFLETRKGGLSKESLEFLEGFLDRTPDELLDNWVKNTDGNHEKSSKQLLKTVEWRRVNDIENIKDWVPAAGFDPAEHLHRVNGFTDEGHPLIYGQLGLWDSRTDINNGHRADLLKEFTRMIEGAYKGLNTDPRFNETLGQWIAIIDMNGFTLRQVTSIRTLSAIAAIVGIYENNYPLHAKHVFIINAPSYFTAVFQIIKNVVSSKGLQNFQLFASNRDEWYPVLAKVIQPHVMPKELL